MYIIAIVAMAALIFVDQFTKYLATTYLKPIGSFPIVEGVFEFFYTTNDGAAFSILRGFRWGFIVLAVIVLSIIVYYFIKLPKTKLYNCVRICLVFVSAGAVGNAIDRALYGKVVDFFYFKLIDFAVFNVADIYVVCGCIALCVILLFFVKDGKGDKKEADGVENSLKDVEEL